MKSYLCIVKDHENNKDYHIKVEANSISSAPNSCYIAVSKMLKEAGINSYYLEITLIILIQ